MSEKNAKKVNLSRDLILSHAHRLMKEGGPSAVSMRRVADAVGVAPMSLYTHVKNKDDLIEGILSLVMQNLKIEVDFTVESWVEQVSVWMHSLRQQLNANPEVLPLFRNNGRYSAAYIGAVEVLIEILTRAGFSSDDLMKHVRLINWTVFGFVLIESSEPKDGYEGDTSISQMVYEDINGLFDQQVKALLIGLEQLVDTSPQASDESQ